MNKSRSILGVFLITRICLATPLIDKEHQVKAAFVYNFAKFIEWPDDLGSAGAPFVIGTYGASDYDTEVEQAMSGKSISGHRIVVEQVRSDGSIKGCRVVVVGEVGRDKAEHLVKLCTNSSVVLVGESSDFTRLGGTIGFALDSGRVRFDINLVTAKGSNVAVSSKLLSLARHVYR